MEKLANEKSCQTQTMVAPQIHENDLKELGFETASQILAEKKIRAKKLMVAYEHYRFVTSDLIDKFNSDLKRKTYKEANIDKNGTYSYPTYDMLKFQAIRTYTEIPPANVLEDLKLAKSRNCFDEFEIAKVQSVEVRPDPIIFGRIHGCADRFFISQWDNDVKIEDILQEGQG